MAAVGISSLDRYRASMMRIEALDAETERQLAVQCQEGDQHAGRRLIEANLPFVLRIAREYRCWGIPLEDLVQQGNIGLLRAARKYDPHKSCRLVTYAAYWIRAELREYVVRSYRIVRLGSTRTERRAMRAYRRHAISSAAELAEVSGMPRGRADLLWPLLVQGDMSLDARHDGGLTPLDRVRDDKASPEERVSRTQVQRAVRQALEGALEQMSDRERRIVRARMLADTPCTLEQLGTEMGVSKERVRQLEERARRKLRDRLAAFESLAA